MATIEEIKKLREDGKTDRDIMDELKDGIKNCPESLVLEHAGHFLQETRPKEVSQVIIDAVARSAA